MTNLLYSPALATPDHLKYRNAQNHYTLRLVREKAQGCWPHILESLRVDACCLKNKHGPCPACGGKDRFRFDDKEIGAFYCNKCGSGDGFKLLQLCFGWSFSQTLENVAKTLGVSSDRYSGPRHITEYLYKAFSHLQIKEESEKNKARLRKVWFDAKPVSIDDPVDIYLRTRGIELNSFSPSLRYHSRLSYYEDKKLIATFPAMIGMVKDEDNEVISLHRTYLGKNGKADVVSPKKLMSPSYEGALKGSAIKLYEPTSGELVLAEGIETALAFHFATQIPAWATISAYGMEHVILPTNVSNVIIAVDNDESNTGQKAALNLTKRLLAEGRRVKRVIPPKVGTDFADLLMEGKL